MVAVWPGRGSAAVAGSGGALSAALTEVVVLAPSVAAGAAVNGGDSDGSTRDGGTTIGTGAASGATATLAIAVGVSRLFDEAGRLMYQSTKPPCRTVSVSSTQTTETSMPAGSGSQRWRGGDVCRVGAAGAVVVGMTSSASTGEALLLVESKAVAGVRMPENLPAQPRQ